MSNAKKCDRCGKCFDPLEEKGDMIRFKSPIVVTYKTIKEHSIKSRLLPDVLPDEYADLCSSCSMEFKIFFGMEGCEGS